MYRVENASRRVEKEIVNLPTVIRERIIKAIMNLADAPRPAGVRKLSGEMQGRGAFGLGIIGCCTTLMMSVNLSQFWRFCTVGKPIADLDT